MFKKGCYETVPPATLPPDWIKYFRPPEKTFGLLVMKHLRCANGCFPIL
jgi:hypothetical protein